MRALFHRILAGQGPGEALVLDFMHKPAEFSTVENLGKVRRGIEFAVYSSYAKTYIQD